MRWQDHNNRLAPPSRVDIIGGDDDGWLFPYIASFVVMSGIGIALGWALAMALR